MSEMALTADHLVIIGRGQLLADLPTAQLIESSARRDVLLRSPRAAELGRLLTRQGATVTRQDDGALVVTGLDAAAIGDLAAEHGIALHALVPRQASLEDAYLDLTGESTDYRGERTDTMTPSLPRIRPPPVREPPPSPSGLSTCWRSEWTKFRSVRSTYWSLLVAVVTPVAVSAWSPSPSPRARLRQARRPTRCCPRSSAWSTR